MTDITDQDIETARKFIAHVRKYRAVTGPNAVTAVRVLEALLPTQPPTLADEMRRFGSQCLCKADEEDLSALADRVEAVEKENKGLAYDCKVLKAKYKTASKERDEARAEVERLRATHPNVANTRHGYEIRHTANGGHIAYAEMDGKPVQKGAESNAETPDPDDVKPGEAWLVECRGERRNALKDNSFDTQWNTVNADGWPVVEHSEDITLVSRLVPELHADTTPHHPEGTATQ